MSKVYKHNVEFPTIIDVTVDAPLDNRTVVEIKEDLTNGTLKNTYPGMVVYVQTDKSLWLLVDNDSSKSENWKEIKDWKFIETKLSDLNETIDEDIKLRLAKIEDDITKISDKLTGDMKDRFETIEERLTTIETQLESLGQLDEINGQLSKIKEILSKPYLSVEFNKDSNTLSMIENKNNEIEE